MDEREFDGTRTVVIGGSSGIGYATAERVVAGGGRVVIAARDDERRREAAERRAWREQRGSGAPARRGDRVDGDEASATRRSSREEARRTERE